MSSSQVARCIALAPLLFLHIEPCCATAQSMQRSPAAPSPAGTFALAVDHGPWFGGELFEAGLGVSSVAAGDLNGDGNMDLASANYISRNVAILLGKRDGTFSYERVSVPLAVAPVFLRIAEIDGNQGLDLVVVSDSALLVLLNRGNTSFFPAMSYPVGRLPLSCAAADLDGDGDTDVTTTNYSDDDISVFFNRGDGTLDVGPSYGTGDGPESVALADLDADGDLDVVVSNSGSATVSVFLNQGAGALSAQVGYGTGSSAFSLAVADFDVDGDLEVAVSAGSNVSVLPNHGDGTFAAPVQYAVGYAAGDLAAGDFDRDGAVDLAVITAQSWTSGAIWRVNVLRNLGNGTFGLPVSFGAAPNATDLKVLDADGNGSADLALGAGSYVMVLVNDGAGGFPTHATYSSATGSSNYGQLTGMTAGDLDGDRDIDLVTANWGNDDISLLWNDGSGAFAQPERVAVGGYTRAVVAAPLDGDADLDLAVLYSSLSHVAVLLNDGGGQFSARGSYGAGLNPTSLAAGDLDVDGDLDLAMTDMFSRAVSVLLNAGDGSFAVQMDYEVGVNPVSVALGDVDRSGSLDLAVANGEYSNSVSVLLNRGDATFAAQVQWPVDELPNSIALADLDGDLYLDIVTSNRGPVGEAGNVSILWNDGAARFSPSIELFVGYSPAFVQTADVEADGDVDVLVGCAGSAGILFNKGKRGFRRARLWACQGYAITSMAADDFDGDGDLDIAAGSQNEIVNVLPGRRIP